MSSFKNRKLIPKKLETSFTYPTMTSGGLSGESTNTGSASLSNFLVFYSTVALISLFVFFSLISLIFLISHLSHLSHFSHFHFLSSTFFLICGKCLSPDKKVKLLTPKLQIRVTQCMNVLSFHIICKKDYQL